MAEQSHWWGRWPTESGLVPSGAGSSRRLADLHAGSIGSTRHVQDRAGSSWPGGHLESPTAAPSRWPSDLGGSALFDQWIPVVQDPADPPLGPEDERRSTETDAVPAEPHRPLGPFDDLVAAVGQPRRDRSAKGTAPIPLQVHGAGCQCGRSHTGRPSGTTTTSRNSTPHWPKGCKIDIAPGVARRRAGADGCSELGLWLTTVELRLNRSPSPPTGMLRWSAR